MGGGVVFQGGIGTDRGYCGLELFKKEGKGGSDGVDGGLMGVDGVEEGVEVL